MRRINHLHWLFSLTIFCLILFVPVHSLAKNRALADQYWQEAQARSKQGQYLKTARMYEKAVAAEQEAERAIEEKRSARSAYGQLGFGSWSNLPGTLVEVNELSAIIKDGDMLIGDKVTENRIKQYSKSGRLAQYKVLHFATHGLVVPEMPELSAIVLSRFKKEQNGEDGYLRMGEIAKLNLAADFVNLSACETGLGKIVGGEGIVGLTQSFLIAGANGLSVSLWQVVEESTARFMTELYKKVQSTGIGYRQALTEVKRGFINGDYGEQWRSPYYWSPFVYYGN